MFNNAIHLLLFKLMNTNFSIIGLAVSFSPTTRAMMAEALRLVNWFRSNLVLIHVGTKDAEKSEAMQSLMNESGLDASRIKVFWVAGDPADQILKVCKQEKVDLLVAGALKKENLVNHYLGTVARKIMRKAKCSIWMITDPATEIKPLKNIVVDAEDGRSMYEILKLACTLANKEQGTWVHIVRELKLLGLALSAREQCTEAEYDELQRNLVKEETMLVEKELARIPHYQIKINIKLLSGKSGFELAQFARRKTADLLIINAPQKKLSFFDRIFTHDQEYIFSDLPCNLLILQSTPA
jgi:nucleotide-binding universal stress UspA family protein